MLFIIYIYVGIAGYSKPHLAPFTKAMELCGIEDPRSVVHVGDNYLHDVVGGYDAGTRFISILSEKLLLELANT